MLVHISIHAPRVGRDQGIAILRKAAGLFQSTRPVWGATGLVGGHADYERNFNPRAPCGARLIATSTPPFPPNFNPRAPCGARPRARTASRRARPHFNPRAPCGARHRRPKKADPGSAISIHAPRVGRDFHIHTILLFNAISIHAPRVGRDGAKRYCVQRCSNFNPRAPCGARPGWAATGLNQSVISIHAPRVGRDYRAEYKPGILGDFNPRAPCGARLPARTSFRPWPRFQSTRPVGGATVKERDADGYATISIHAPRVGRDATVCGPRWIARAFQSTRPVWGATYVERCRIAAAPFQSTRPVWGATSSLRSTLVLRANFNPRAPCGARRRPTAASACPPLFQSTRPVWGATANLTILPRQICTKGTKEFLLGRKTHGKKEKIKQKLAYIHAFSAFLGCEGSGTFCALVLRTQYR